MAHLSFRSLFLLLVPYYLYLENPIYVNALNIELEAGKVFDYFVENTRNLRFFDELQNIKSAKNGNKTDFATMNINNPSFSSGFPNEKIHSYQRNENEFNIINLLKNMNDRDLLYKTSTQIEGLKLNSMKNKSTKEENLEEFGRELLDEGRKVKTKKLLMKMLLGLKVLTVGVILPLVLGIALFASWKGITVSLMALLLAGIVSIKNVLSSKPETPQHVIVAPVPSHHQHWWRKTEGPDLLSWENPHELAYSGHR
ncbi:uncharacterized protein LOC142318290 [Lycorma delicatula]|uniref:uncharacterized protein LOC142318290 n=1 Tax=Lycorma delicatula TaxID=130591 RepID=UPI003F5147B2